MSGAGDRPEPTIPPGAVMRPRTSLATKTGTWREWMPQIDHDACTGCGRCVTVCPDGVIKFTDGGPESAGGRVDIDYRYCKGCGICERECPIDAIAMVAEGSR